MTNNPYLPCFYRVSIKALIYQDNKLLLVKEPNGKWELPGGGLEIGESFLSCLTREIKEEIGVNVIKMSSQPLYTWAVVYKDDQNRDKPKLILCFPVEVDSFNFKNDPEESIDIGFFSKEEIKNINLHPNFQELQKLLGD